MAGPRNPGGPSTGPPPPQAETPYGSSAEERTAAESDGTGAGGRWEVQTVSEKGSGAPSPAAPIQRGSEEISASGEDSGQFLIDTGVTQEEGNGKRRIAAGTGETGSNSIDAP